MNYWMCRKATSSHNSGTLIEQKRSHPQSRKTKDNLQRPRAKKPVLKKRSALNWYPWNGAMDGRGGNHGGSLQAAERVSNPQTTRGRIRSQPVMGSESGRHCSVIIPGAFSHPQLMGPEESWLSTDWGIILTTAMRPHWDHNYPIEEGEGNWQRHIIEGTRRTSKRGCGPQGHEWGRAIMNSGKSRT